MQRTSNFNLYDTFLNFYIVVEGEVLIFNNSLIFIDLKIQLNGNEIKEGTVLFSTIEKLLNTPQVTQITNKHSLFDVIKKENFLDEFFKLLDQV